MSEATRWNRVKEIFDAAAACRAEDRAALLRELCGDDRSLQAEVESLLSADADRKSMFVPAVDRDLRGRVFGAVAGALGHGHYALLAGQRVGPFEIIATIGRGGMGEVYRARDTKLNRDVALKILPAALATDADRLARFRREAQLIASLNHPNIAHIYGLEDAHTATPEQSAVSPALVLELVEGPTLADRISKRPMPLADALPIARQIAEALETAHEQGVVHRDLKPANVKVRADGMVKVLDFGLARALSADSPSSSAEAMESPTMTGAGPMTDSGVILGTAPYMSPEQARGKLVDKRADIWAFGCVLYEMLTGRRPFDGETSSDTIAAILTREPDWTAVPRATPSRLRGLLQRCLEKDPKRRLRDIGEARIEIEHLIDESATSGAAASHRRSLARWAVVMAVFILLLAGVFAMFGFWRSRPLGPVQFTQITDFADTATAASLSPDGRWITFIRGGPYFQNPNQIGQIYVKQLPNGDAVRLTNDPRPKFAPVFTSDGTRVAYSVVDGGSWDTWTVPVLGGEPAKILPNASGLTWLADGRVLFSEMRLGMHMGIVTATEVRADSREIYFPEHERAMAHYSYASPDRKWVLIVEMGPGGGFNQPCRLVPFDGSLKGRVVGPDSPCRSAAWSPDGGWMYFGAVVDNRSHLWRQAFPDGAPEQVTFDPTEEEGIAVAPDGKSLVTSVGEQRSAIWIHDEAGDRPITSEGSARLPQFSRDGRHVFYLLGGQLPTSELRRIDLASGKSESVLPGWSMGFYEVSPDAREVAFTTRQGGQLAVWLASLDRRSAPREVTRGGDQPSFGPGGVLIFRQLDRNANYLSRINRDGTGGERLTSAPITGKSGLSPDGEWVIVNRPTVGEATSQEPASNRVETVVISLRSGEAKRICAFNCMQGSAWSPDGRYLYLSADQGRTAVIPLPAGQLLPDLPASGIHSPAEVLTLPGAQLIDQPFAIPSAKAATYVFLKTELRRNLFRVQLR